MHETKWVEPASLREAVSFLAAHRGEAYLVAGATDLLMDMRLVRVAPRYLLNVNKLADLSYIRITNGGMAIGALTKIRDLETSHEIGDRYPAIAEAAAQIGSIQIRNLATIGGNLAHASPSAEMAPPLLVLDASVELVSARGERSVPLAGFFTGPGRTVVEPDELVTEIRVPPPAEGCGSAYLRLCVRDALDIAIINVAAALVVSGGRIRQARIALGAVGPTPVRAGAAEEVLVGQAPGRKSLDEAAALAVQDANPISDVRASAGFRRDMVEVLTRRALEIAGQRAAA